VDGYGQHRRDDSDDNSCRHSWAESSFNHAGIFPAAALQPDLAFYRLRRHVLHGL
jgi:hypothetical protein